MRMVRNFGVYRAYGTLRPSLWATIVLGSVAEWFLRVEGCRAGAWLGRVPFYDPGKFQIAI